MAEITIRRCDTSNQQDLNKCDSLFLVEAEMQVFAENGRIRYTVAPVSPYVKRYEPEDDDPTAYISRRDHAAWLAYAGSEIAGQVLVRENWNGFAYVQDLAVDPAYRRHGIGGRLLERAIGWARERGLPGAMVETQNINVPACRLYERCGFVLAGFDGYRYRGVMPGTNEVALFWYLVF